ncbi:MAG: DoxX family membrane protein [bacterium]
MNTLVMTIETATTRLSRVGDWVLPTLARLVFAAVLLGYFWASALTKFDGPFSPTVGAYAQIYPRAIEAASYDAGQLGLIPHLVVLFGGWAEFVLPLLLTLGLLTRLAALGMVGFIVMQSLTDIYGHMVDAATIGAWFDRASDALILDQRAFWVLLLGILITKGAGPLSLDHLLRRWLSA